MKDVKIILIPNITSHFFFNLASCCKQNATFGEEIFPICLNVCINAFISYPLILFRFVV